jgi:hypothetical protein
MLRRLVYDELTGDLLDYSTSSYTPDARLRDLLRARDVTCRHPGCPRPAEACDVEHATAHHLGGQTSMGNCSLMCRRHHNGKTHDGHRYERLDPATGEVLWTTPLGFTYRQTPTTYHLTGTDPGNTSRHHDPGETPPPRGSPDNDEPPF